MTKELFGKEMDPIPIAVKFDYAMELSNGTMLGYREEGHVDTGKCMQMWYFYYFYAMNT